MKNNILIIVQDTNIIQTYSGFIGNLFKKIYLSVLFWRTSLLISYLSTKGRVLVLTPDSFILKDKKNTKIKHYSQKIAKIDIGKFRKKSLNVFNKLLKVSKNNLKFKKYSLLKIWQNQITVRLSYYYFPYLKVIDKQIEQNKPKEVWILGKSKEEKIARFLAEEKKVKVKIFPFLDLSWINNHLQKKLYSLQLEKKKEAFLSAGHSKTQTERLKNNYLLSADFFRHLKTLVPLYKELKKRGKDAYFLFDVDKTAEVLKDIYKIEKDYIFLSKYLYLKESDEEKKISTDYGKEWKAVQKNFEKDKKLSNIILSLENYFQPLLAKGLDLALFYLKAAHNLIENSELRGLVFINETRPMERALMMTAKANNKRTVVVHPGMFLSPDKTSVYESNYFSALGENIKKELKQIGYPSEKIIVNGDPQLDFLPRKIFNPEKIYQKLGIPTDKKIILLVSDKPNPMLSKDEKRLQFQAVYKSIEDLRNCRLVVKPHPAEERQSLIQDLKVWKMNNFILTDNRQIELYDLLSASSVVIIAWSMVGFEAMLFEVPVIVANFSGKDYDQKIPYVKGGGAVLATDIEQLRSHLQELIDKESSYRKKLIKKGRELCSYYYRLPLGKASKRVVDLICQQV